MMREHRIWPFGFVGKAGGEGLLGWDLRKGLTVGK
jgi:hypothetical protein